MSAIKVSHSVQLASAPKDVWPLIVDTDRMNRLIGMEPVSYRPLEGLEGAARFLGETRLGGFHVVYEEYPYEWSFEREFGVYRRFLQGPLAYLRMRWRLDPMSAERGGHEGGTELTVTFEAEARSVLLRPFAWMGGRKAVRDMLGLGERIDAHIRDHTEDPFAKPVAPSDPDALARARARVVERGVRQELAERLAAHVRDCADADAIRIRPFEIADEWGLPRREVLAAFLHAVASGLVELRWAIVCPSCRTASQEVASLSEISLSGHCQMCDIAFELDLDRAVEATFHPHPAVRRVPDMMFCAGGPARTPHVLSQLNLEHGQERTLAAPGEAGRYRIFSRGGARASLEVDPEAPAEARVHLSDDKVEPADLRVRPGGDVRVENAASGARHVKLERLGYASAAATAHEVSTLPEFRSVFSGDLLKRETPLKVARVAIFFSDLTGSTALYSAVGDAAAFRLVDDHFDVMRAAIAAHEGVVVKTMGDAVMASFVDEKACILAALECLERFETFRAEKEHGARTHIKLGVFAGACYVVTANAALDYFGQTVNVASRLQHLAESGELIIQKRAAALLGDDPRVVVGEPFSASVKGVAEPLELVRVKLAKAASGSPGG